MRQWNPHRRLGSPRSTTTTTTALRTQRKHQLAIQCGAFLFLKAIVLMLGYQFYRAHQVVNRLGYTQLDHHKDRQVVEEKAAIQPRIHRCAIGLYGLPRAFATIVVPSIEEHVIRPNAPFGCDYFVHYYNVSEEASGRSGSGGQLHPDAMVEALRTAVEFMTEMNGGPARRPTVLFETDTNEQQFWDKYGALVEKVRTIKDQQGRYLYYPWKAKTYTYPTTTDNILKMWHSIQSSWELMQKHGTENGITYTRVAMLRNDVLYMTPIHIWEKEPGVKDTENNVAVIPSFGMHPVSDRLIYGPARAVEIWAAQRFERLEAHVQWILQNLPGWGLHSERFVNYALLPPMRDLGFQIQQHPTMCFFRTRADESVWISDCQSGDPTVVAASVTKGLALAGTPVRDQVERLLGRKCGNITKQRRLRMEALDCSTQPHGHEAKHR